MRGALFIRNKRINLAEQSGTAGVEHTSGFTLKSRASGIQLQRVLSWLASPAFTTTCIAAAARVLFSRVSLLF